MIIVFVVLVVNIDIIAAPVVGVVIVMVPVFVNDANAVFCFVLTHKPTEQN